MRNLNLLVGGTLVSALTLLMIISLFYIPYSTNEMNIPLRFHAPDNTYLLGTDNFGRDILSRLMEGSQTAFLVGAGAVAIGLSGGFVFGAISGYFGGWIDEVLMRVIDALLSFPGILLALVFVALFEPNLKTTILAIGIMSISSFARIIRSGFMQYKEADFVRAAKNFGANDGRLIFVYIFPNLIPTIIVTSALCFSTAILVEAALSYLGLGVQPPSPSWGGMLSEAQSYLQKAPWFTIAPGLFITATVLGFNLLGDGIREITDARMKV